MKMIVAMIRPEKLQNAKDALAEAGAPALTITHVTGRGAQAGMRFTTRVGEFCVDEIEKIKIEAVVPDKLVEPCIKALRAHVTTGHIGDGRIFVLPVERSICIRTGEEGNP